MRLLIYRILFYSTLLICVLQLGDAGYASCVSKFCRGQRMALDALRERRRKSKELHQFLAAREQQPLCGRLQLKDMLACVWQRYTAHCWPTAFLKFQVLP